jgi:hypothetical protein
MMGRDNDDYDYDYDYYDNDNDNDDDRIRKKERKRKEEGSNKVLLLVRTVSVKGLMVDGGEHKPGTECGEYISYIVIILYYIILYYNIL